MTKFVLGCVLLTVLGLHLLCAVVLMQGVWALIQQTPPFLSVDTTPPVFLGYVFSAMILGGMWVVQETKP